MGGGGGGGRGEESLLEERVISKVTECAVLLLRQLNTVLDGREMFVCVFGVLSLFFHL